MKNFISNSKNILIIVLTIIITILIFKNYSLEKEFKNEQIILTDSLYDYRNKIGELYKQKDFYITTNKELEKINSDLYKEIKKLKDNPIIITETETIIKIDSIYVKSENKVDSLNNKIINDYNYNDNYLSMKIKHTLTDKYGSLQINDISMFADITHSIIEDKKSKKLSIITKSNNPYLTINDINGGFIGLDNSKTLEKYYKRINTWGLGFSAGYGVTYDNHSKRIVTGPVIMFGISKSIVQW